MYAHKAIEDLKMLMSIAEKKNEMHELFDKLIPLIKESQKFHLGSVDKNSLIEKYSGARLFDDPAQEKVRLPYQNIWIDWNDNNSKPFCDLQAQKVYIKKYAVHIYTLNERYYNIFLYYYNEEMQMRGFPVNNAWTISPIFLNLHYCDEHKNFIVRASSLSAADRFLTENVVRVMAQEANRELTVINMFLDLLTCKNIDTIDHEPPAKLNKSRKKKGKCPIFTYKTLVIKPTSKKQKEQEAQGLWNNRIHLCRGHFKEYTEEKPLFGKFTGRYWWQPSVRGKNKKGVVMKDYKVETEAK